MQKARLVIGSTLLMASMGPLAQANQLYIDGSVGNAEAETSSLDADDTFLRIGAGITLTDQISAEAGFWDFGSSRDAGVRMSADAFYGAIKAGTDIGNNLNLYGRLGLLRWDADVGSLNDDGHDFFFGGGLGFQVGPGQLGFELHYSDLDSVDIRTLGVSYTLPIEF